MTKEEEEAVVAEIEAFRADLRRRSNEHARKAMEVSELDLPAIDVSQLELPQIRAVLRQRYADARYERRLSDVERRLAELEARNG